MTTPDQRTHEPATGPVPRLPETVRNLAAEAFPEQALPPRLQKLLAATYGAGMRAGAQIRQDSTQMMTPKQVLALLPVDRKTVKRWAAKGILHSATTAGGHHRYRRSDVIDLAVKNGWATAEPPNFSFGTQAAAEGPPASDRSA